MSVFNRTFARLLEGTTDAHTRCSPTPFAGILGASSLVLIFLSILHGGVSGRRNHYTLTLTSCIA